MNTRINQERVKVLRLGKSWTQQRLAEEAGISLRSMQRIEAEGTASLQSRAAIAAAFGIEPNELDIEEANHNSTTEILLILVAITYFSFYFALLIFEISLQPLPVCSIPLIPSMPILIFGLVLQSRLSQIRKTIVSAFASIFLTLLISPPDLIKQAVFAISLWMSFELFKAVIPPIISRSRRTNVVDS